MWAALPARLDGLLPQARILLLRQNRQLRRGGLGALVTVADSLAHRPPSPSGLFLAEPGWSWVILEDLWALTGLVQ